MTLTLIGIIILVLLVGVLGLGVFSVIPMTQVGINRLSFVVLVILILLYTAGTYWKH